jgi:hypothetical protein
MNFCHQLAYVVVCASGVNNLGNLLGQLQPILIEISVGAVRVNAGKLLLD